MKQLFIETYQQLSTLKDSQGNPAYIRMWNGQLALVLAGKMELFQTPAYFIEFVTADVDTLLGGEGVQLYNPIYINIHILHWQLDAAGQPTPIATFEENLDVFDIKQKIFLLLQKFKPSKGSMFVRIVEEQDYDHDGVYHFIQKYRTTWVDDERQEPYKGSVKLPPTNLEIDLTIAGNKDNTEPQVYTYNGLQYSYKYDSTLTGTPAAGKVQFNNPIIASAVSMFVNNTDRNSSDQTINIGQIKVGDVALIAKDANNYFAFVIKAASDESGQRDFTLEFIKSAGAFANNDNITISIY